MDFAARRNRGGIVLGLHRRRSAEVVDLTTCLVLRAVVLDPPFDGAAAQTAQIAAAKVPVVIYVSCNPATLARDARLLHRAGYRLRAATPIDQFLWSERLESVCVFAAPPPLRREPQWRVNDRASVSEGNSP
jgi:23S rRNA (uracil1939-C5)-methyltransferase